jgi:putative ABC transport system permease protein
MIPIKYNAGNLSARRAATAMTIVGIGVVIAVMLAMIALYHGVMSQFVASGSKDLLLVMQEGSDAELSSRVPRDAVEVMRTLPGVAKISPQLVVLFKLPKKDNPKGANVTMRGVAPNAFELRPYVRIVEGRMFRPGLNEVVVARRIHDRFVHTNVGDTFQLGPRAWNVVGVFDAQGTAYDSEMWADVDYLMQARKRESYSSVLIQPADRAALGSLAATIRGDRRLQLQVRSEAKYFADQTTGLAGLKRLVAIVTFFMAGAAIFGTMNTMFSAVASRGRELATLRALGFGRRAILGSMMIESAVVALLGGVAGIVLALPVNFLSTGTMNPQTMSEVAFNFRVDGEIALIGIAVALGAGIVGGILPALAAASTPISKALREI